MWRKSHLQSRHNRFSLARYEICKHFTGGSRFAFPLLLAFLSMKTTFFSFFELVRKKNDVSRLTVQRRHSSDVRPRWKIKLNYASLRSNREIPYRREKESRTQIIQHQLAPIWKFLRLILDDGTFPFEQDSILFPENIFCNPVKKIFYYALYLWKNPFLFLRLLTRYNFHTIYAYVQHFNDRISQKYERNIWSFI